ncbi:BatD family protein [Aurantibacillus circumpalustris]|uniref:BatD family protein n=1 Tax=Aurantibacillus circumpalustris TaxID=3036359 RepID=UPI00295B7408|nr:BatD family protein [Aurantibacillus circumpalustris]
MNKVKFWIVFLFSSVLLFQYNKAQSFYGQVSSKKVQVGTPFDFQIVITVNASNYIPPAFKDFEVAAGPYQSNSSQNINGVVSQQIILSYGLVAKREGKLTIEPASIVSGGQKLESQSITIEAVKSAAAANAPDPKSNSKIDGGDLFIKTGLSTKKCYIGEQVTIIQKVYCRLQIVGLQKFIQPSYDGFYSQAQESTSKGIVSVENVDGVNYNTYELYRTEAIANKSGKITLPSIEQGLVIRKQTSSKPRNIFEQFFGANGYEDINVNAYSKPVTIEVLPLPEEGKPENFNGAVGVFQCKIQVTRNELKANEAFNLKMTITGKGNLKLVGAPNLELPEGFETYAPKISEGVNSKTFDYLVIPRNEGEFQLKGLDFSYFSLDTKRYVTVPSGEILIKVLPPDPNSVGAQVYTSHSQVKETENDVRYIKKGNFELLKSEKEFFNSSTHIILLILPLLGLVAVLILRGKYIKNNSNQALVNERKAAKLAKKQLVKVEKLMLENKKDEFYTEVLNAMNNYLSHKLFIPVADLSRDKVKTILVHKLINETTINKLVSTLDTSEYAKYAPGAVSGDLQSVYRDTVDLITDIEQQLNKKAG